MYGIGLYIIKEGKSYKVGVSPLNMKVSSGRFMCSYADNRLTLSFRVSEVYKMDYLLKIMTFVAVLAVIFVNAGDEKKLQIGIKKRPDNCVQKSKAGDMLFMHYTGALEDGTKFDSSYDRGKPLSFTLGSGQVIRGWDQGLLGMCVGEKRKLVIPPEMGYGSGGAPPTIPGDAMLIFEVELVKIQRKNEL
ncbi:peptidyl-prolyl cis-trans isomerase FKBP2-like [Tropilaelaps mercedesae]|uniref:peptidylprolyl isomerase n=1 Tax=Tropilaelaps mercedesae TaxID=418985 RepID=A0A1V9XZE0_9ACAR|nr:peptidyl-prolyl cis-trans isomerase FKBP2-like [Tropilaelaps mercedesae]